jgi:hypothetical protein
MGGVRIFAPSQLRSSGLQSARWGRLRSGVSWRPAAGLSLRAYRGGHAILKDPGDFIPVQAVLKGLGAVPVWFVKLSEVQPILAGNKLTTTQLLACPSLRKGVATQYSEVDLFGMFRPQGEGNGSIEVVANGSLDNGGSFELEWRDMGKKGGDGQDFVRHARIAFH